MFAENVLAGCGAPSLQSMDTLPVFETLRPVLTMAMVAISVEAGFAMIEVAPNRRCSRIGGLKVKQQVGAWTS